MKTIFKAKFGTNAREKTFFKAKFGDLVSDVKALFKAKFGNNGFEDFAMKASTASSPWPPGDAVNLRSTKVGDDGLKSLVATPSRRRSRDNVATPLSEAEVGTAGRAAGLPHGLTSLNLNVYDTEVGDDGLKFLAAGLRHSSRPSLATLSLM